MLDLSFRENHGESEVLTHLKSSRKPLDHIFPFDRPPVFRCSRPPLETDMLFVRIAALAVLCLLPCISASAQEPAVPAGEPWQAGIAKVDITPAQSMWMSGYASRDKPAQGKIHELWAKAVVLQDPAGHKLVLITLDLVGIDRVTSQQICERLQTAHQLERSQIAIATSHTHSGPVVGTNLLSMYSFDEQNLKLIQQYTVQLSDAIAKASADAFASLAPALISTGKSQASFAVNRRNNREADVPMLRENGMLVGPVDHTLPVISVRDLAGKLRGVVFGYACHATVLSLMDWSGDWPGFAQLEIEKRHPDTIAMFWAGCGADQNPLPRRTVELAAEYGRQTADGVDRALQSPMQPVKGALKAVYREIDLALDHIPTAEELAADAKSDNVYIVRRATWLSQQVARDGKLSPTYPYPIQIWGIGNDVRLTFLGGEVVVDYALRLSSELPGRTNWIAGYSNDVMAYIPSKRVLLEGGYEGESSMIYYGLPSKWAPDVEEHIVKAALELGAELEAPTTKQAAAR